MVLLVRYSQCLCHVTTVIMNEFNYSPTELHRVQAHDSSYCEFQVMLIQRFIPYVVCR
jgi:hypothetical protein